MGSSSTPSAASKVIQTNNKEDHEKLVTITEKVSLTKNQYEVLNIICSTYEESVSQYLQDALIEAMRFDIEEGNFSDVLLEKVTDKKEEKVNKEWNTSSFLKGQSVQNNLDNDLQF
jgi:RNA processing factor Prp31